MDHSFSLLFSSRRKIRMKLFVVLASLVVAICAASDQDLWIEFKATHGKTYRSLKEEQLRFKIFQEKLREIELHNAKYKRGEVSYYLGINQFSDMTSEEFEEMLNKNLATKPNVYGTPFEEEVEANLTAPSAINWVQKGAVMEVKNQGRCGSCWAFSTTGSIEGQSIIKHNKKVSLSEQQLVDCSTKNHGCFGGLMNWAFDYVKGHGLQTEAAYPYKGVKGACKTKSSGSTAKVNGYVSVGRTEDALKKAVGTVGPISIALEAKGWQSYKGGVYDHPDCSGDHLDHGVLAVGYGHADGHDYWLIKNSWGQKWGENGYIRLARNKRNQCGVAKDASYPKL